MTNSYSLSRPNRIIFIHGLNNNRTSLDPLRLFFEDQGFDTELVILPCHGENRFEARNLNEAMELFHSSMVRAINGRPYYALAFSHGALYLQLWMKEHPELVPEKQVLLAPAIHIRRQAFLVQLYRYLPSWFVMKSLSPAPFRRYQVLSAWEYGILVDGMLKWQSYEQKFDVPTKLLIDPKDELVNAGKLRELFQVDLVNRPYARGLGSHHVLFHPDYFTPEDWKRFIQSILSFLRA